MSFSLSQEYLCTLTGLEGEVMYPLLLTLLNKGHIVIITFLVYYNNDVSFSQ